MAKVIRHEFLGSTFMFWLLWCTAIGIPIAILYLLNATVTIEEEIDQPDALLKKLRKQV